MLDYASIVFSKLNKDSCKFLYDDIVRDRSTKVLDSNKVWVEKHHIVPRWICNDKRQCDSDSNIVSLLPREHFLCHWLLYKYYGSIKSCNAFLFMCGIFEDISLLDIDSDVYKYALLYEEKKIEVYSTHCKKVKVIDEIFKSRRRFINNSRSVNVNNSMMWWNNGIENVLSSECPGEGWKLGMTKAVKDKCKVKIAESKKCNGIDEILVIQKGSTGIRKSIGCLFTRYNKQNRDKKFILDCICDNCIKLIKMYDMSFNSFKSTIYGYDCISLLKEDKVYIVNSVKEKYYDVYFKEDDLLEDRKNKLKVKIEDNLNKVYKLNEDKSTKELRCLLLDSILHDCIMEECLFTLEEFMYIIQCFIDKYKLSKRILSLIVIKRVYLLWNNKYEF